MNKIQKQQSKAIKTAIKEYGYITKDYRKMRRMLKGTVRHINIISKGVIKLEKKILFGINKIIREVVVSEQFKG